MAVPVSMPRQGQSVETCIIGRWHHKKGDSVKEGDILLSYETDKAAFDLEAPVSGVLLEIFYEAGEEVPVLANIAVIGKQDEPVEEFRPSKTGTVTSGPVPDAESEPAGGLLYGMQGEELTAAAPAGPSKVRISPRARRMAEAMNIPTGGITGSGPYGRIIVRDILQSGSICATAIPAGGPVPGTAMADGEFTVHRISNLRQIIAGRMHASLQQSAQLTHHISADARRILACRSSFKSLPEGSPAGGITINDMVCYAVTRVLPGKKYLNSHFLGDQIRIFNRVHLGFAVDTERGLMVPVLKNADTCSLTGMSLKMKDLADRCRRGNIDPELLQGSEASFTVSNLGAYGIEMFTPVLNLPQTGILGINTIIKRPADLGEGVTGLVPFIGLSLTYDHRAVDGAPASAFLAALKAYIESFEPDTA
jgi:pyruvate dehydrogenase E2 component (dihydrolipoamide acetyltransferase)